MREQAAVLDCAASLLKPGGAFAYVTCSVLEEENGDQIRAFLARHGEFSVEKPAETAKALGERGYLFLHAALTSDEGVLMTPRRTDTDGFFVSRLRKN
jgi:16S rRNA (cytosine967-C5)-methyltransferase